MSGCCGVEPIRKDPSEAESSETTQVEFAVYGMGCGGCAQRVQNSLLQLGGVSQAKVDHTAARARVTYNPRMTRLDDLFQAVVRAGGDGVHNYRASLLPA